MDQVGSAPARPFDRNGIERAIATAAAAVAHAAAAARIMHYLQLLFPLRLESEIYRLRSDGNPSGLGQCPQNESRQAAYEYKTNVT